jgi:hypothetical protein
MQNVLGQIRYKINKESKEFSGSTDCYVRKILALNGNKTRSCYEVEERTSVLISYEIVLLLLAKKLRKSTSKFHS